MYGETEQDGARVGFEQKRAKLLDNGNGEYRWTATAIAATMVGHDTDDENNADRMMMRIMLIV
jgi:hypothetical protein